MSLKFGSIPVSPLKSRLLGRLALPGKSPKAA